MKKINAAIALSYLLSSSAFATTLSDALVHTYQTNPELIAEREKLKSTDEKMFKAISGFLPKVYYKARKTEEKQDAASNGATPGRQGLVSQQSKLDNWRHTKSKNSSVNLEQNLFNGGQDIMAIKIAKYYIEAGRADLLSKEQEILLKAINAYLEVVRSQEVLDITKENYQAYEKKYQAVKDKVEVGVAKKADLADASSRRANAETNLIIASGNHSSALASYIQIIGLEPENVSLSPNLSDAPVNQMELLQKSLDSNPQLKNISFQKEIADISVISSAATLLPSVDVGGSIGKNWQDTRGGNTESQPYTNTKAVYVSVTVPIYQQGTEYSGIRSSKAQAAQYKYLLKNTKASITQGVTQAWTDYMSAQGSVKSGKEAVEAAAVALVAKQQEYDEGVETLTNLLDAQENLFQYKIKLAQVTEDAALSYYKMASLMGRLNAKDLSLPTKIYNSSENYDKIKFKLVGF